MKQQASVSYAVKAEDIPDELKNSPIFLQFLNKKTPIAHKQVYLPKSDFSLVFVSVPKDNPIGTDPAELNTARLFVFNLKNKQADSERTQQINQDLQSESDEQKQCGGSASLDLNSFVANQEFVHLDQFFAPGMERTSCVSKIYWDNMQQKIIVQRIETITE